MNEFGQFGEDLAIRYLKGHGYEIAARNYRTRVGEIDIVARQGQTLVFIEVKARSSREKGSGDEAISFFKKRKLARCAQWYLQQCRIDDVPLRFDVISIIKNDQGSYELDLIENAFECDGLGVD